MCGIAGIRYRDPARPASADVLKSMLDRIVHRGPDDWGHYEEGSLAIGMRRLSIIDLSTGHQPIHNEDRTVWTVFNGEIYNFLELRPMLEAKGHRFYTNTDTEMIVHLWEEYGPDFVRHLRGMFGIAVWDSRTKTLMLVRDRLGIKPVYWCENAEGLFFGSEMKALLAIPSITRRIDPSALREYLSLQYVSAPRTIFEGVNKLPPAHYLLSTEGKSRVVEYWDAPPAPIEKPFAQFKDELLAELETAVRLRLISDVPLGAFLSGGIDSSAVVALMARQMKEPVKSFSIGFDYAPFDEMNYARLIAKHFGTDHAEEVVHPDAIDLLPKLVWHFDEPFGDSSAIPTYYVCRMARKHVTVALSGDGGDELFGGYRRYRNFRGYETADRFLGALRGPLFRMARALSVAARQAGGLRSTHASAPVAVPRCYEPVPPDVARSPRAGTADRHGGWRRGMGRLVGSRRRSGISRPDDVYGPEDVPPRRYPLEGRPNEYGGLARGTRPAPRPQGGGTCRARPVPLQGERRRHQVHPQGDHPPVDARGLPHAAEDGIRRSARPMVPRRPSRLCSRSAPLAAGRAREACSTRDSSNR